MTDAPKLIHVEMPEVFDAMGFWQEHPSADLVPYTSADLIPAMLEAARLEALEEAATILDHERDACRKLRQEYRQSDGALGTVGNWFEGHAAAIRALAASPPTPTAVDGENSGEPVGNEALHRSFLDAGDGRPMPPMGDELMIAGLSEVDARFVAVQLARNGLTLRDWRETAIVAMELAHRDYMTGKCRDPDKYTSSFSLAAKALKIGETVGKGGA